MMEEDFHVTLSSNVSRGKAGNFTTIVPRRYLEGGHWYVGLTEIRFRNSWYNLKKYNKIDIIDKHNTSYSSYLTYLPPGRYDDINELLNLINKLVIEIGDKNKIKIHPSLEVLPHSHKILHHKGSSNEKDTIKILLGYELSEMLGITEYESGKSNLAKKIRVDSEVHPSVTSQSPSAPKLLPGHDKISVYLPEGKYTYDLSAGISYLMVYTDIVSHSIVGNVMAPLLRVVSVPSKARFGDNIVITYDRPLYMPVRTRELQSIEIDIKDDTNETIDFKFGHVECGLNFIKKYG